MMEESINKQPDIAVSVTGEVYLLFQGTAKPGTFECDGQEPLS